MLDSQIDALCEPRADGIYVPRVPVQHRADEYDEHAFDALMAMQRDHFWYKGRHRFLLHSLDRRLNKVRADWSGIDIGGGCGGWLRYLAEQRPHWACRLALADSSLVALHKAGSVLPDKMARYQADVMNLGWSSHWDVGFMLDVIEHIPDNVAALKQAATALKPNGLLFVTAPALTQFWSYNDEMALHLRRYWRLDWGSANCPVEHLPLRIAYEADNAFYNHSRVQLLSQSNSSNYIFHSMELTGVNKFLGVDISSEHLPCIRRFSVLDGFDRLPLFPNLRLGANWKDGPLYQTLGTDVNPIRRGAPGVTQAVFPVGLALSADDLRMLIDVAPVPANREPWAVFDDTVNWTTDGVVVNGQAPTPFSYVLQSKTRSVSGNAYAVVSGEVLEGGVSVGLIDNGHWAALLNFDQIGKFQFFFKPPAGTYQLTVAHNVPYSPVNHFRLHIMGWVIEGQAVADKR